MARIEADREDLFEEFRAATHKWELRVAGIAAHTVLGVRKDGRISFYFGGDPCYHFSSNHELQRAFAEGWLYRSQGTTLARLHRERTPDATSLIRHDLSQAELNQFLETMRAHLSQLQTALGHDGVQLIRAEPENASLQLIEERLAIILSHPEHLAAAYPTRKR